MTRKDFRLLAHELAMTEPSPQGNPEKDAAQRATWTACIHAVKDACAATNARFDADLFLQACHFDYWKRHKL